MSALALYTNNFPYGGAETFLETEIKYLALDFEEIIIVPFSRSGQKRSVPDNVRVLSPIQEKKWSGLKIYLTGLTNFYRILEIPELRNELRNHSILKCIKYLGYGILTKRRLLAILPCESAVHYSYWLSFSTFALALLRLEGKVKVVVSRAHGYDLYEERGERGLAFIKAATISNLDKLFFISEHGVNYLLKKFPDFSDKYFLSRLGTPDPGFTNPIPDRNYLTLVSCSAINANKRVYLILDSLIFFKTKYPSTIIKWYHFGNGQGIDAYKKKAERYLNDSSIHCYFTGHLPISEIMEYYRSMPVNLFINVSESEGLPISIMEAQSCGIPVMAPNVGGIPEIVTAVNGCLLPANPTPDEIASEIYDLVINTKNWEKKRILSRKNWEDRFDGGNNYRKFTTDLISIINFE